MIGTSWGRRIVCGLLVSATLALVSGDAGAHEGHDHGAPPPPVSTTIAPRVEASSEQIELVAVARGGDLVVHLDEFRTNAPLAGASIQVDSPIGVLTLTEAGEGTYVAAAPFVAEPGRHDLAITVIAGDVIDILAATLVVPEPPPAPQPVVSGGDLPAIVLGWLGDSAFASELRQRATSVDQKFWLMAIGAFVAGNLAMLIVLKRLVLFSILAAAALITFLAFQVGSARGEQSPALASDAVLARDLAQRFADGALFVPKPTQRILAIRTLFTEIAEHRRAIELPGRIIADPNASGLVQPTVTGRLTPREGGFPPLGARVAAGEVLAMVQPSLATADAIDQQQQAHELDQQIASVTRKLQRLRSIERLIARSQIEDAEIELKGLNERRANLARAPRRPEPLVAPVSGVIALANAIAGQIVEPSAIVFEIVDPASLIVEALAFEPSAMDRQAEGLATGGQRLTLAYLGTGMANRNQALPVHFRVEGDTSGLRIGQFVTVLASGTVSTPGIALPREAVLRSTNGQSIVYEHTNAERFVPREVRFEPLDAARVLIVAGLDRGRRIVTQGAELLNQIR
ncbi:MAG: HlyD family efflux transporter periplasmic adaptor subunit [Rhizobiales bacterium]|nr:HlyD family efflux transporter periplasmic adaptor subunit [Hyphomicrobiales bacterium]